MEMSGHFHVRAILTPEKRPPLPVKYESGWAADCLKPLETGEVCLSLAQAAA
jgi:hypothetical protein